MADVHIPGIGNVPRSALLVFVSVGVGIVGYAWWRHRSGVDTTATDTTATTPTTYDTSGDIDPSTGVPYAEEYADYSGLGLSGYYTDASTGAVIGSGYGPTQLAPATTNSAWAQQVEATLETLGYDPITVSAAIGQQGYPPEGALPIHTQSTSTTTPTTPVTVGKVTGLKATHVYAETIDLDWTPVTGATGYTVWVDGKRVGTYAYSNAQLHGLKAGHKTRITVAAERNGAWGATGTTIYVTTKKHN